jgi:HEAT repeat protein
VRRAAIKVLNEIGDANAFKDLLAAIKDTDW